MEVAARLEMQAGPAGAMLLFHGMPDELSKAVHVPLALKVKAECGEDYLVVTCPTQWWRAVAAPDATMLGGRYSEAQAKRLAEAFSR